MKIINVNISKSLLLRITIILLFLSSLVFSSGTGVISGHVEDKDTGEPIIGANIIVVGTYQGTAADVDGNFQITGLTAGDYDIRISTIGYKVQLHTGVKILDGKTVVLNIIMEPTTLALGQEVVVVGKKSLFQPELTSSLRSIDSKEISQKMANSIDDLIEGQSGVVKVDNEIHIRGGRADENLYIIDGVSVKDPLSGKNYGVFLSTDVIEELEVITGGFNAEYGQAMSGIIEVKTKEGGQNFHGSLSYKTDHMGMESIENFNTDAVEVSFSGPEPITNNLLPSIGVNIPGSITFFSNAYMFLSDTYLPHATELKPTLKKYEPFALREENNWSGLFKLTWKNNNTKVGGIFKRSLQVNQGYFQSIAGTSTYFPYSYVNWLNNYNTITWEGIQTNLKITHSFNAKSFVEIDFGRVFINVHSAVQGKYFDEYNITNDLKPIQYLADFPDGDITVWTRDGFYDTGDANNWHDHYSETYTLETEFTSQISTKHRIKSGFELKFTDMQVINIDDPWLKGGNNSFGGSWDIYRVQPSSGALYFQDKIVFEGMIINVGMRCDYMILGEVASDLINNYNIAPHLSRIFRNEFKNNTFDVFGRRGKAHLSPRLGISHPLTDNDVLFFSYGHFSQRPNYQYIYAGLNKSKLGASPLLGNPDLNPSTTVAYEIGVKHKFSEDQVINITAFYKDLFDYATSERLTIKGVSGQKNPFMYFNMDYARSRGIEVYLQRRFSQLLSVRLNGTYSIVTGKSSSPTEALDKVAINQEKSLDENFMSWDVPFRFSADFNFFTPKDERMKLLDVLPLPKDLGIFLHWQMSSGRRYTPMIDLELEKYADTPNSELADSWMRWDVKFTKGFYLKKTKFDMFCQFENILNAKIARSINPVTGKVYEPGDPLPRSWTDDLTDLPPTNPSRYREPRNVMLGLKIYF